MKSRIGIIGLGLLLATALSGVTMEPQEKAQKPRLCSESYRQAKKLWHSSVVVSNDNDCQNEFLTKVGGLPQEHQCLYLTSMAELKGDKPWRGDVLTSLISELTKIPVLDLEEYVRLSKDVSQNGVWSPYDYAFIFEAFSAIPFGMHDLCVSVAKSFGQTKNARGKVLGEILKALGAIPMGRHERCLEALGKLEVAAKIDFSLYPDILRALGPIPDPVLDYCVETAIERSFVTFTICSDPPKSFRQQNPGEYAAYLTALAGLPDGQQEEYLLSAMKIKEYDMAPILQSLSLVPFGELDEMVKLVMHMDNKKRGEEWRSDQYVKVIDKLVKIPQPNRAQCALATTMIDKGGERSSNFVAAVLDGLTPIPGEQVPTFVEPINALSNYPLSGGTIQKLLEALKDTPQAERTDCLTQTRRIFQVTKWHENYYGTIVSAITKVPVAHRGAAVDFVLKVGEGKPWDAGVYERIIIAGIQCSGAHLTACMDVIKDKPARYVSDILENLLFLPEVSHLLALKLLPQKHGKFCPKNWIRNMAIILNHQGQLGQLTAVWERIMASQNSLSDFRLRRFILKMTPETGIPGLPIYEAAVRIKQEEKASWEAKRRKMEEESQ